MEWGTRLPGSLAVAVFGWLDANEFCRVEAVCLSWAHLARAAAEPAWRALYRRDWDSSEGGASDNNWKDAYRSCRLLQSARLAGRPSARRLLRPPGLWMWTRPALDRDLLALADMAGRRLLLYRLSRNSPEGRELIAKLEVGLLRHTPHLDATRGTLMALGVEGDVLQWQLTTSPSAESGVELKRDEAAIRWFGQLLGSARVHALALHEELVALGTSGGRVVVASRWPRPPGPPGSGPRSKVLFHSERRNVEHLCFARLATGALGLFGFVSLSRLPHSVCLWDAHSGELGLVIRPPDEQAVWCSPSQLVGVRPSSAHHILVGSQYVVSQQHVPRTQHRACRLFMVAPGANRALALLRFSDRIEDPPHLLDEYPLESSGGGGEQKAASGATDKAAWDALPGNFVPTCVVCGGERYIVVVGEVTGTYGQGAVVLYEFEPPPPASPRVPLRTAPLVLAT